MRNRILLLGAILCLIMMVSFTTAYAQQSLVIGVENKDWPGHYEWKGDVLLGVDADIVRAVAAKLRYQVEFRSFPWKRVLRMAEFNEIDGALDVAPIKAREKYLHYVWTPITREGTAFWVKKGSDFKFDGNFTPSMKVGLMLGADWSDRFARQGMPTVKRFSSYQVAFSNLEIGHIDMFANYLAPTRHYAAKHYLLDKFETLDLKYEGLPYYLVLSTKDGHDKLAKEFARELKRFYKSAQYQDILKKYNAMDLVGDIE